MIDKSLNIVNHCKKEENVRVRSWRKKYITLVIFDLKVKEK